MRRELTRGTVIIVLISVAAVPGAVCWLLLGAWWAVAGIIGGPPAALVIYATVRAYTDPEPGALLDDHEPYRALTQLHQGLPVWRTLARVWPGRFREPLAQNLLVQAEALQALGRTGQALAPAAEAVAIWQDLAAGRPARFTAGLAEAAARRAGVLAAAGQQAQAAAAMGEAARLYRDLAVPGTGGKYLADLADSLTSQAAWLTDMGRDGEALAAIGEAVSLQDRLPHAALPQSAARALLLDGALLTGQGRHHEAVRVLARGWHLAAGRRDLLAAAVPALRAAYRADQSAFIAVWHTETGGEPPTWLTS